VAGVAADADRLRRRSWRWRSIGANATVFSIVWGAAEAVPYADPDRSQCAGHAG
jgi:hypothetical protein